MSDLAVPLITAAAVIAGAVVGQASTIVNTIVTGRRDRADARDSRRREAYAAFIEATQGILQSITGLPPIEQDRPADATNRALGEVARLQRAWATLVIVGTPAAREAANAVKTVASGIQSELTEVRNSRPERAGRNLASEKLRDTCDKFVEAARQELN